MTHVFVSFNLCYDFLPRELMQLNAKENKDQESNTPYYWINIEAHCKRIVYSMSQYWS